MKARFIDAIFVQICEEEAHLDPEKKQNKEKKRKATNDERKTEEKAKAIITGGTMALLLLAASLVTTSFLMSPLIENFLGCKFKFKSKYSFISYSR